MRNLRYFGLLFCVCNLSSASDFSPADYYLSNIESCQRLCKDYSDPLYKFTGSACVADCGELKLRNYRTIGSAGLWQQMALVKPSGNNRAFVLYTELIYEVGTSGIVITIPKGFVTDYASIPEPLWSLYSPHAQYSRAAVVHDYLYWSQLCTRSQADNLFMIAMKESEVDEITRNAVYSAVSLLGKSSWEKNRQERIAGMPKVVPMGRNDFHPNATWESYRKHLISLHIKDPVFSGNDYCVLGNSTEVPIGPLGKETVRKAKHVSLIKRPAGRND